MNKFNHENALTIVLLFQLLVWQRADPILISMSEAERLTGISRDVLRREVEAGRLERRYRPESKTPYLVRAILLDYLRRLPTEPEKPLL